MRERLTLSSLPVRPEYVRRVRRLLESRTERPLADIIRETRLTRTQALSALDALIRDGVVRKKEKNIFWLVE